MHSRLEKRGFTLIELSIVIVIIGLIVGGILVGRDLILSSEMRSQISQLNKLDTALHTFKLKYLALAGDIADATTFGLTTNCTAIWGNGGDGNGDGKLTYDIGTLTHEDRKIFCHLSNANLIGSHQEVGGSVPIGSYNCFNNNCTSIPAATNDKFLVAFAPFVGMSATHGSAFGFYIYLGSANTTTNIALAYTPINTYFIELKMDDGLPNTGNLRAWSVDGNAASTGAAGSANCISNGTTPNPYNLSYTATNLCTLGFKMSAMP